jgi:hypothetical protein
MNIRDDVAARWLPSFTHGGHLRACVLPGKGWKRHAHHQSQHFPRIIHDLVERQFVDERGRSRRLPGRAARL